MKTTVFTLLAVIFTCLCPICKAATPPFSAFDTVVIDLSQANLSLQYIDIPVYVKSPSSIFSFDYAFRFNLSKLTYSATISVSTTPASLFSTSFFSSQDLFLRSTNSTQVPLANNTPIHSIRFTLSAPCTSISASDFTDLLAIINGTQCAVKVSSLNFSKFIPTLQYSTTPTCVNSPIIITNTSSLSVGTFTSQFWKVDGQLDPSFPNTLRQYSTSAQHTLTIIHASAAGCTNTLTSTFSVTPNPTASFSSNYLCQQDSVQFINTSSSSTATLSSYFWHFNDGTTSTTLSPQHKFPNHKVFQVILTVTDTASCTNTTKLPVSVLPADFSQDGVVDISDYLIFAPNYQLECQ